MVSPYYLKRDKGIYFFMSILEYRYLISFTTLLC